MSELYFLLGISVIFTALLAWGFKFLPGERWQMIAVVPLRKRQDNSWHGLNFTYYGFFIATSQLLAVILLLILLKSLSISLKGAILTIVLLLAICVPSSRIVAFLVERKRHTFTIGGASFVGIILAPWCLLIINHILAISGINAYMPVIPTLSAVAICYTLGEGLGRLGCISYGCCYGKPVCQCSTPFRKLFEKISFTFTGPIKKAVYEGQFAGERLVPIQAITAVIYTVTSVGCCWLFLQGFYTTALLLSIVISQGWRLLSESFRADFRGFTKFSAYQKMALIAIIYITCVPFMLTTESVGLPSLLNGFNCLWNPSIILGLQFMWIVFFYFFGKSSITNSTVSFNLLHERI